MSFQGINPLFSGHTRIPYASEIKEGKQFTYIFEGNDDDHIFEKMAVYSKYGGKFVLLASAYDILFFSRPRTIGFGIQRILKYAKPVYGCGLAYLAVTAVAASLRKHEHDRNHPKNHVWGGIASGIVATSIYSGLSLLPWTFFSVLLGYHWKKAHLEGIELNPYPPAFSVQGFSMSPFTDYTVTKERPADWYKDDPSEMQKRADGFYARYNK